MANHKSAEKRARQSVKRQAINSRTIAAVRTAEVKLRKALAAKDAAAVPALLITFKSRIDKAAQKGRLTRETASRKIARLSKQVSALAK